MYVCIELRRRQERDLELAKQRKARNLQQQASAADKDRRLADLAKGLQPDVERDAGRLLTATKASEHAKVHAEDLLTAEERRHSAGAHSAAMAMSGRDLLFSGRAKPAWMNQHSR